MAFTMHSHSGQFCPGHAKDQLEDVILRAIEAGFTTIGLTEHMPRTELSDLYPEEGEWIRAAYGPLTRALAADPAVDYVVGSVHHARGVPVDLDAATYAAAVRACGGSERALFAAYFDEQLAMLRAVRPRVVGHFDLVRLFSAAPGRSLRRVWARVVRNLDFVRGYGGWLECNTSALRKGLAEPYPQREIAEAWVRMGGRFTFSDDSHGTAQVATHYRRGLDYLESLGVREVWTLERRRKGGSGGAEEDETELVEKSVSIDEFRASLKID
ncbi:hypothetical protein VTH06DRAFT_392 [Thermothelomyces fergusii]